MDPVASLDVDDVVVFKMRHGMLPSLALQRGFSGLSLIRARIYGK